MRNVYNLARSAYYGGGNDIGFITVEDAEITLANWREEGMEGIEDVSPAECAKAWNTIAESEMKKEANPMSNTAIWRILDLPDFLNRNRIFKANTDFPKFSVRFAADLIRFFEKETAAKEVTFPVEIYLECMPHSGTLTVRRDGTHAIRLNHDNDEWKE